MAAAPTWNRLVGGRAYLETLWASRRGCARRHRTRARTARARPRRRRMTKSQRSTASSTTRAMMSSSAVGMRAGGRARVCGTGARFREDNCLFKQTLGRRGDASVRFDWILLHRKSLGKVKIRCYELRERLSRAESLVAGLFDGLLVERFLRLVEVLEPSTIFMATISSSTLRSRRSSWFSTTYPKME